MTTPEFILPAPSPQDLLRLFQKIAVDDASGCWNREGTRIRGTYGQFNVNAVQYLAHRVAYAWFVGPIPADMTIDHLCKNPGCVNPDHLECVSQLENNRRSSGAASRWDRRGTCAQGHPVTPENTRYYKGWRMCRVCHRNKMRELRRKKKEIAA